VEFEYECLDIWRVWQAWTWILVECYNDNELFILKTIYLESWQYVNMVTG